MPNRPTVVVFDVNETLSDMSPMAERFADVGAERHLAKLWFATLLRDGFALTAAGSSEAFARLGEGVLRQVLADVDLDRGSDDAVAHVMAGFGSLALHPDVVDGVTALRASGLRLVTLSNGSTKVAEALFDAAGVRGEFEALLSVEDAGVWKPARGAYEHAARECGTDLAEMLLVAVHPWDIDGAQRAGMSAAWLNRAGSTYPDYFTDPTHAAASLTDLARTLTR
jgi:2-haloacid dehalogenase